MRAKKGKKEPGSEALEGLLYLLSGCLCRIKTLRRHVRVDSVLRKAGKRCVCERVCVGVGVVQVYACMCVRALNR